MKLLTKKLLKRFKQVGKQDVPDPIVIAKFFNPTGAGTWYATSYDEQEKMFYGYVYIFGGLDDEWGYFSLQELEQYHGRYGLGIERDLYFDEGHISEVLNRKY